MLQLILPYILPLVARFIPDPGQAAQFQAELSKALLDNEQSIIASMSQIMQADAASEGWLTRNARPIVVMWGLGMITFIGLVAPAVGIQDEVVSGLVKVPDSLWTIITTGVGIWFGGRTIEKVAASLAPGAKGGAK